MVRYPTDDSTRPVLLTFVLACFFVSGATALMYEVLWTRMLILLFGATTFAISTVLTVFMGGLALGSVVIGRRVDRSSNPLMIYGVIEVGIGLYALAAPMIFESFAPLYRFAWSCFAPSAFVFALIRFVLVGGALLVPTFLMGGTLPALSRFCVRRREQIGAGVGRLYALNTLGAVIGTFSTGFLLLPWLGVGRCTLLASSINIVLGVLVVVVARGRDAPAPIPAPEDAEPESAPQGDGARTYALWVLAAAGFTGMIYEVAWSRTLSLIIGSSVYAFTIILTTFLVGIAAGSFASTRFLQSPRRGRAETLLILHALIGVSAYLTTFLFARLPYVFTVLFKVFGERSPGHLWAVNFAIAAGVMFPATFFSGALFPVAVRIVGGRSGVGRSVGRAYACNTVGCIVGSFSAAWILIVQIGIMGTILFGVAANVCVALAGLPGLPHVSRRMRTRAAACGAAFLLLVLLWHPSWNRLLMSSGMYKYAAQIEDVSPESFRQFTEGESGLVFYKEGLTATVTVAKDKGKDNLWLAINGKIDASSASDMSTQVLSAHLPMALAPKTESVLVIGFASGVTVGSVLQYPVKRVAAVEIESAVIEASYFFAHVNHRPWQDPRLTIVENDGRNYLAVTDERFDVIISEPSNPWITGASNLFTKDFFELGRSRLNEGGLFCQWVQLYGLGAPQLKTLLRTFRSVFESVLVFETMDQTDLVLLGSTSPVEVDCRRLMQRTGLGLARTQPKQRVSGGAPAGVVRLMGTNPVRTDLARIGVCSLGDFLSYFKIGSRALPALIGDGPLNTDDNALIEFSAARTLHLNSRKANDREIERYADSVADYLVVDGAEARQRVLESLLAACKRRKRKGAAERLQAAMGQAVKP